VEILNYGLTSQDLQFLACQAIEVKGTARVHIEGNFYFNNLIYGRDAATYLEPSEN